jgi:hypothetical protein
LTYLDCQKCSLWGSLPSELGKLKNLQRLWGKLWPLKLLWILFFILLLVRKIHMIFLYCASTYSMWHTKNLFYQWTFSIVLCRYLNTNTFTGPIPQEWQDLTSLYILYDNPLFPLKTSLKTPQHFFPLVNSSFVNGVDEFLAFQHPTQ